MTEITDEMCKRAIDAMKADRIQGFSTPLDGMRSELGPPYYLRDVFMPPGQQELWRGEDHDEMMERHAIERMRIALHAALSEASGNGKSET
jgi:hypothetical protein